MRRLDELHLEFPFAGSRMLRGMEIERPNQVWAMDITYIPMARGFVYLAVVLDWFSRRVLAWRLSITMEASFCIETLQDALASTASRMSSTPIRARSSLARPSPACSPTTTLPSAWTARARGVTARPMLARSPRCQSRRSGR
jgi:transposase InsO family protein